MKTRINWKLLIVILLAVTAVGITGVMLRQYHRDKRAADGYKQGINAFNEGRWQDAAVYLGQYISINQQDVSVLLKYAQSNARIDPPQRESLTQAVNAYRAVLRLENNEQAAIELTKIYFDADMPAEAEIVLRRFINSSDIRFKQYLAQALTSQRKYGEAVSILMQLINRQPDQVMAFDLLGRIAEEQPSISRISAQGWFDKAIEKNPNSAGAYVLRSAYWARQGQMQKSAEDLRLAEKCTTSTASDLLGIAAGWIQQGRLDEAWPHIAAAEKLEPNNPQVWQIRALWAQHKNDPAQMLSAAHDAIEHLGWNNYSFLPIASELFVLAEDEKQAQQCIDLLKNANADRSLILYLEGLIANLRMDWANAIDRWQQAINLGYAAEPVYLNLAQTFDRIQNRAAAISLLRSYVKSSEGAFRGHILLGQMLVNEGRLPDAMEQATAAIQIRPSNLDTRIFYLHCRILSLPQTDHADGSILEKRISELIDAHDDVRTRMLMFELKLKQKDYAAAEQVLLGGQRDLGENVQWVLAQAESLKSQGKLDQVTSLLEKALDQYSSSLALTRALASSCASEHQYGKAEAYLNAAIEKTKNPSDERRLKLWLAEVFFMQGRLDKSEEIYRNLAAANASDVYARRQLLTLRRNNQEIEQQRKWIEEIRLAEGENGWQWKYEQAHFLYQNENFQSTYPRIVELLEQNLVDNPDDLDSRILLASTYERANNIQLALSLYRQALSIRPDDVELIVASVGLMYRAEEYRQAQQLLDRAIQQGVQDLRLTKFELQNSLRMGQMDAAVSSLERIILESPKDYNARLTLGLLLIRKGQYGQAEDIINKLISENPDSTSAIAAKAELHLNRSEKDQALAICDEFVKTHDSVQARTLRAQVLLQIDRIQEAVEEVGRIEFLAKDPSEKLSVCELYRSAGMIARANETLNGLLKDFPRDPAVQKQAALIFIEQPQTMEQGKKLLEKALAANPRDNQLRMHKAQLLITQKTADALSEAMKILNEIIFEMPRFETAWVMLGQGAILQKDSVGAMNYITRGLANLPNSRRLLLLKAQAEAMRSPEIAARTLEELHLQAPDDILILKALAEMYRRAEQPQKALEMLEKAFEYPELANTQSLQKEWIAAAYQAGRKKEAFEYVREKTQQSDGNEGFLTAWTGLLVKDGRWKDAVNVYAGWAAIYPQKREGILPILLEQLTSAGKTEAIEAGTKIVQDVLTEKPNSITAIYSMAMLLHHSGQKLQAVPWYEKTIRLNPSQVIAVNNLAWILATEKGELDEALKLAEEGVRKAPSYVDLIDTRGYVLMRMGQYERAAAEFEKCLRMYIDKSPKRTSSMFYLSNCLLELKRPDQAQIEFLRTRRLQEENGGLTTEQQNQLEENIQKLSITMKS